MVRIIKIASAISYDEDVVVAASCTEPLQVVSFSVRHVTLRCMSSNAGMTKYGEEKGRRLF